MTEIGACAFAHCPLQQVSLPASVTAIGEGTFAFCTLQNVSIPASVTKIGYCAFAECPLHHIDIPASVTYIGVQAFGFCRVLKSAIIPTTARIHECAFHESSPTSITRQTPEEMEATARRWRGQMCGADHAGDDGCPLSPTTLLPAPPPVTTHAAEAEAERAAVEKTAAEAERAAAEAAGASQELQKTVAFLVACARAATAAAHAAAVAAESQSTESKSRDELEELLERVMVEKAGGRAKLAFMRMQVEQAALRRKDKAAAEADATEAGGAAGGG